MTVDDLMYEKGKTLGIHSLSLIQSTIGTSLSCSRVFLKIPKMPQIMQCVHVTARVQSVLLKSYPFYFKFSFLFKSLGATCFTFSYNDQVHMN